MDRVRRTIRFWGFYAVAAIVLLELDMWPGALICGALAFLFYHTSPAQHAAIYALEPGLDTASPEFRATMAGATGMPWIAGNRVTVYNNGDEFYPAMLDAVEAAERSITMEQFIYWDSEIGRRFAEAFAERARQGVRVKLLLDAVGSSTLGNEIMRVLEAGGVQLVWYRPIHWYTIHRANHRLHRKTLVIDGRIAFTGGAGIADHWIGQAQHKYSWRDVQVCVEGPAASALQSGFAHGWLLSSGEVLSGPEYFSAPSLDGGTGGIDVQVVSSSPQGGAGEVGTAIAIALQSALREVSIANPYFIPDFRFIEMLANACRRGVKVRLMVAGEHNDTWWARQNSLRLYGKLFHAGVEIFEYLPTMLHQKVMIVDDAWASIGTANFDNRSLSLNEETAVCFHDPALIAKLRADFDADLPRCRRIDAKAWRRRSLWQRVQEQMAAIIEDQV